MRKYSFVVPLQKLQEKHWECQNLQKLIGSDTYLLNPVTGYFLIVSTCILWASLVYGVGGIFCLFVLPWEIRHLGYV